MIVTVTLNPSLDEWVYLPSLRVGRVNRAVHFCRYPGGKGINVSRVVQELGARGLALALAGGDDGHILSRQLTRDGLAHRFVTVRGTTRNNYQIQTASPRAVTQVNAPGPRASAVAVRRLTQAVQRACRQATGLALSGSLPPGTPADVYAALLGATRRAGLWTVLDASGPALRAGLAAAPWLIKPNRDEAEELLGRRLRRRRDIVRAALALTRRGASVVVISLGAEGAVMAVRSAAHSTPEPAWTGPAQSAVRPAARVWWARPPRVRVDSTVGAGDSLVAGFLVSWLRRQSLTEALRLGVACGAAAAMTPGTELCHRHDVRRLVSRVKIEEVS